MRTLIKEIASRLLAIKNCETLNNTEWKHNHNAQLTELCKSLPSGSGIEDTILNREKSTPEKIVIETSFHHMNDAGYYDGYTHHTITVTASLIFGIDLKISGKDRNDIKDYLYDCFYFSLIQEVVYLNSKGENTNASVHRVVCKNTYLDTK